MKTVQALYTPQGGWNYTSENQPLNNPLVLVFANRLLLEDNNVLAQIHQQFPYKDIVYISTAGEILGDNVYDDSVTVTALEFEKSTFTVVTEKLQEHNNDTFAMAKALSAKLPEEGLKHLMVFASGHYINGSALAAGIAETALGNIPVTGGLSGDDGRFERTLTGYNTPPQEGTGVLIGIYGGNPEITYASFGGFQPLGPVRKVTRAENNVLYELDGKPALDLYRAYLGDRVEQKMASLLGFPLQITAPGKTLGLVRTVLRIDTTDGSIVLAGDCPEGSNVQLLMASMHGIASGATEAARQATENRKNPAEAAIIVSCMGRKAIMGMRIDEEIEMIREIIGEKAAFTGFYSYAEIAPFAGNHICEVHNQTLTLTLISE